MAETPVRLRTGDDYRASLRDGRDVWYDGEHIEDVTVHPITMRGVDWNARLCDAQFSDDARDVLTTVLPDGTRIATAWLVPRSKEDLERRRRDAEYRAWLSLGAHLGRQLNHTSWNVIGLAAHISVLREHSPEHAEHILSYLTYAQQQSLHLAAAAIEPQGYRARAARAGRDRSGVLHVVKESSDGIWISGARAVATVAPQADELLVGSIYYPHVMPNESFWVAVPVASHGLRLICRQATAAETADAYAHPLSLLGEEMDALVVFDDVFVPRGRIFALGAPELADLRFFAATARGEYWAHLLRLWVHAEFLLGLAQLVVNALDTGELPLVRDQLGRLVEYATVLRAGAIAAAELATTVGEGIMLPDLALCIALRSYAVEMYPSMLSLVQELCGQGVVMRFSERDFSHPEIGPQLSRYLDGAATSARIRNRIMNLVWDVTASPLAGRVEVYERLQALSPAQTRQLMYTEADRRELVDRVLKYVEMSTEADEPQRKAL